MSQENPIGLADLIEQVKRELLSTEVTTSSETPMFSVDEVTLELQVTVSKEGTGGLKIYVVELGGSAGRDDVQTVKVTLTPLLSKDERIRLLQSQDPERWKAIMSASLTGLVKGQTEQSPDDTFGG
jgi:Trypsin-co-occurring domain 2